MAELLPAVYLARMDVEPEELDFFNDWYRRKHAPDLIAAGFYSASAYHSLVGSPLVCNVYEIESSEIFYTTPYQQARTEERDPDRPRILENVSNRSNTVYQQLATAGVSEPDRAWADGSRMGQITAPVITTVRFETPTSDDSRVIEWHQSAEFVRLKSVVGFQAGRLCRQAGRLHPANPSDQPRWLSLVEWKDEASARSDGLSTEVSERLETAPFAAARIEFNLAARASALRDRDA